MMAVMIRGLGAALVLGCVCSLATACSVVPAGKTDLRQVSTRWRVTNVGVSVTCGMRNDGPSRASASLLATLYDSSGAVVGTAEGGVFQVPAGEARDGNLWSSDTPLRTVSRVVCSVVSTSA